MKIPFVGPSYQARSLNADAQRAVNCFIEMDNASPRAPMALYGTPGLDLKGTLGAGPVRGAVQIQDDACVVSGNQVWHVTGSAGAYSSTLLGTINSLSGPVGMAYDGAQVLIVDGVGGWLATASTLTQITDPDFPAGVTQAGVINGYFVVTGDGTQKFYIDQTPRGGSTWNGLDFASAEGAPDNTISLVVTHLEVWLGGSQSFEVWVFTGNPDFPLERSSNAFIQTGAAAANSVQALDNTIYWLGRDRNGAAMVFRAQGYTPARVSTHAVEKAIAGYATISDAISLTYQQEGHSFYVLTFPTEGKTWVYDVSTNLWHERAYRDPNTGVLTRWRPSCHVYVGGNNIVGDFENGNFYALDLDTYSDNGDPILRLRSTQCMDSPGGERNFYEDLQVDMETGVGIASGQGSDPQLMLRYSNDGGHVWSNLKTRTVGKAGEYGRRAKFGPTGAGRNRVWEISMTDPVKFAVFGAYSRLTRGTA